MSDGVERFTGEERAVAWDALFNAKIGCLDHPIARVLHQKIWVVEVQFEPGHCPAADLAARRDYRVVLRAYTFFGIPTGMISVCGDYVDCRGLFWPEKL